MTFTHLYSKKKLKIKCTQIPIQPAFSMTAYKSQGVSLERVVVDLESCSGSEAPYVMVSRVKSLDGLMVLCPFTQSRICCHMQEDVHDELKRQRMLELGMLSKHGVSELATTATAELSQLRLEEMLTLEQSVLDLESSNLDTLVRHEAQVGNQIMRFSRHEVVSDNSTVSRACLITSAQKWNLTTGTTTNSKRRRIVTERQFCTPLSFQTD